MTNQNDREREIADLQARLDRLKAPEGLEEPATPAEATKPDAVSGWVGIGCVGIALLVIGTLVISGVSQCSAAPDASQTPCEDSRMAYVMSQSFMEQQLRAPATADFPGYGEARVASEGSCRFRVTAYVDAQNGFGAQIRTHYTAVIVAPESGDTYRLESLDTF